jgi:pimeloyl-ACP methyl ester carboxylesterase
VIEVDGIRTHFLEAGEGPTVVLLHSGEFGGCAELSWEYLFPLLSPHFRLIAPDWLGFGFTDKLHDFCGKRQRMVQHMARFVETMAVDSAHFVGNSMGATYLLQIASEHPLRLPVDKLVAIAGGGFAPINEHRKALLDYDGSLAAMRAMLTAMMFDPKWRDDDDYIARRQKFALIPGAWEATAAARFKRPGTESRGEFGQADQIPYEQISVPCLIIAGQEDVLRLPAYTAEMCARIPKNSVVTVPRCGHCPNIEAPDIVAAAILEFLT